MNTKIEDIIYETRQKLKELELAITFASRSCIDCDNFQSVSEFCMLAKARPPAKVIAQGCELFSNDIPF